MLSVVVHIVACITFSQLLCLGCLSIHLVHPNGRYTNSPVYDSTDFMKKLHVQKVVHIFHVVFRSCRLLLPFVSMLVVYGLL